MTEYIGNRLDYYEELAALESSFDGTIPKARLEALLEKYREAEENDDAVLPSDET
jgi:hypothetical protein